MYSATLMSVDWSFKGFLGSGEMHTSHDARELDEALPAVDESHEIDRVRYPLRCRPLTSVGQRLPVAGEDGVPVGTSSSEDSERLDRLQHAIL